MPFEFCLPGDAQEGHSVERQRLRSDDLSWCSSFAVRKPFVEDGGRLQKTEGLGVSGVCEEWCLGSELACFLGQQRGPWNLQVVRGSAE